MSRARDETRDEARASEGTVAREGAGMAPADLEARLVETLRANAGLEEALREAEVRALESQINPHFLFNTLSTIAAQAMLEGAGQTQELLGALARLLRYSLRKGGRLVTMAEEVNHVRDYLTIQCTRFGSRITSRVEVEGAVLAAKVPVLTVQPLVENAFIHGLEDRLGGSLTIRAAMENGTVLIEVRDDGVGMTPERLAEVVRMKSAGTAPDDGRGSRAHTTGLGLAAVEGRLQRRFGRGYGLEIESVAGGGTVVRVRIPFVSGEVPEE